MVCSFVVAQCVSALHESRSSVAGMGPLSSAYAFVVNLCCKQACGLGCASGEKLDSIISLCSIILSEYTRALGTRWHC